MSHVTVQVDKIAEDILKSITQRERELERINRVIVSKYRKWWNSWMYKGVTDKEIIKNSLHYGFQRCSIMYDIDTLKLLQKMCEDAMLSTGTIALSRRDYGLIYE